jgi:hypothetical protein
MTVDVTRHDELRSVRIRIVNDDIRRCRLPRTPEAVSHVVWRMFNIPDAEKRRILHAIFLDGESASGADNAQPDNTQQEAHIMGRHGAKKYEAASPNRKVTYKRWQYARGLILKLRERQSVTEVSRAVKGHGQTPNWAAAALDYREQISERDIRNLEEAAGVPKPGSSRGLRKGASQLDGSGKGRMSRVLATLCNEHGWNRTLLGDALGIRATTVSKLIHKGGGDTVLLRKAEEILAWMQTPLPTNGTKGEAEVEVAAAPAAPAFALDPYHAFVVQRYADLMGVTESEVVARMVEQWVVAYAHQVEQARACLRAWEEVKP